MKALQLLLAASMSFFISAVSLPATTFAARTTAPLTLAAGLDGYQNPDGSYPSLANVVRDINGTPCGIECQKDVDRRWSMRSPQDYTGLFRE